jgi:hypothetical protein
MYDEILNSINQYGKTKLAPSLVCDGVGVFAITHIPSDYILFQDVTADQQYIPYSQIQDPNIRLYLSYMCNSDKFGIYLSRTYNNINMSYYVNHSDTPNVYHDLSADKYITLRDIRIGEELTCTYTKEEINWLT